MLSNKAVIGCLLGTAIGDALGLPYEALSKNKQNRLNWDINKYHFLFGKGMVSDDTEHTCMIAQSLIISAGEEKKFTYQLAWRLRFWLLCLPAGVGFATLRATVKLWLGFPPRHSGVFSAGNGPAMRSAIIGVCYGDNGDKLTSLVKISTRITHRDPKAEYGALAIAIAAYLASQSLVSPINYYHTLEQLLPIEAREFLQLIHQACESAAKQETGATFAISLGLNSDISGYIYHTVPMVIQVWLRHQQDYQGGITEIIKLGGDTDTTAAILGGIIGANVGKNGIPKPWLDNLAEFPRSINWMEKVGERLTQVINDSNSKTAVPLPIHWLLIRNLLFVVIVISHGFWRLILFLIK